MAAVGIGIIGCGNISSNYLRNSKNFPNLFIKRLADLDVDRAKAKAEEFDVPESGSVDQLLADDDVQIVLNLTIPAAHLPVAKQALEAGKHVYNEKPLGAFRDEGLAIMKLAEAKGLRVGAAPDTFLGAGHQTARKLIDDGKIGKPLAGTAFMMGAGHESWHPAPEFYYEKGGGPMFDMGPYYLTALMNMLGPIRRVMGVTGIQKPVRTITSEPKKGQTIEVKTPDHVAGTVEFENGAIITVVTSFAVRAQKHSRIEIYGEEGSLSVPDPNGFDGEVEFNPGGKGVEWETMSHTHCTGYGRSAGLSDMAAAIASGRPHRASGQLAMAVLDVMQGFLDSSDSGSAFEPGVKADRPAAMPVGLTLGEMD